ncbi:hypothetical protein [Kocuria arenosa]|uniref:hypothetical protein n=1 Tax=Kocuria arenosa TaxID=3071446 RepID=UPI0034D6C291
MLDALAAQQARQLHQTIIRADLPLAQLWWRYLSLGGNTGQLEVEAYLHQALDLPRSQRELLDHAAHELLTG